MQKYNLVAENPESTVVSDYRAEYRTEKEYQSEADLERAFIKLLTEQAYDYLPLYCYAHRPGMGEATIQLYSDCT